MKSSPQNESNRKLEELNRRIEELDNELAKINSEMEKYDNLCNEESNIKALIKQKNTIFEKIRRFFLKKARLEMNELHNKLNDINSDRSKVDFLELSEKKGDLEGKKKEITEQKEQEKEYQSSSDFKTKQSDFEKEIKDMDDITVLKEILSKDKGLCSNVEFMKEAIKFYAPLIMYDKTNDPELYVQYLEIAKKHFEEIKGYTDEEILELEEEINNPKKVPNGMYKVPHKYLFEIIRVNAAGYEEKKDFANDYLHVREGLGIGTLNGAQDYLVVDGKHTLEQGEFLEKLYNDDNYYILQHAYSPEREPNKDVEIFEKGKKESSYKADHDRQVSLTFNGNFKAYSFVDLLDCEFSKVLAYMKKSDFHEKGIWGADSPTGDAYLLPQYIIGSLDKSFHFKSNPIPLEDRKKYKYHFKDKEYGRDEGNLVNSQETLSR